MIENVDSGLYIIMYIIQNNKNQVIAILKRNGVKVPINVSNVDLGELVVHTLKVSRSFNADFKKLLNNPDILAVIASLTNGNFANADGNFANADGDFANADGKRADETWAQYFARTSTLPVGSSTNVNLNTLPSGGTIKTTGTSAVTATDPILDGTATNTGLSKYLNVVLNLIDKSLQYTTTKSNVQIAHDQVLVSQNEKDKALGGGGYTTSTTPKDNTTMYIILGIVALAGVGATVYFYKKNKS